MADLLDILTIDALRLASGCDDIRIDLGKEPEIIADFERDYGSRRD